MLYFTTSQNTLSPIYILGGNFQKYPVSFLKFIKDTKYQFPAEIEYFIY